MFLIERRYFRYFDWFSFGATVMLSLLGILFVWSATYKPGQPLSIYVKKQLFGVVTGFIIYFVFCYIDYRRLCRIGYFIYFGVMLLLVLTMIKGHIGMGAQRWFDVGIFRFQPSELAKLFLPAFITYYLETENDTAQYQWKHFIVVLLMLGISFLLIRKQPDLGTAIIVLVSGLLLIWLAGMPRSFFIISFLGVLCTAPILWNSLKEYQQKRIFVFLGYGDIKKERYHLEQSKIAIGSGGLTGKGFLAGTQNKYLFLPESRTDFIFSVLAEEEGFIGTLIAIALYFALFIRLCIVIMAINAPFAQLLAMGLMAHIALSTIINIGMVSGLLPIVGIPLPLMSYGITHLWITYASLGWINGIAIARSYLGK